MRLAVVATCHCIQLAERSRSHHGQARHASSIVVVDALQQFVVLAAILTERPVFLQCTFFLVHAGSIDTITVATLMLVALVYGASGAPYLNLACKVLSRFFAVFTLVEAESFLNAWAPQFVRALGWDHFTEDDVVLALVTMIQCTQAEAIMKHRVLVEVIHSALLRTAVLGLIDKGVPEALYYHRLKTMMLQMEALEVACSGKLEANALAVAAASSASSSVDKPARRRASTVLSKPVDELAAGWNAVGGAALAAGAKKLVNTLLGEDISKPDEDPQEVFARTISQCVGDLRSLVNEIAQYTETDYLRVFKYFEGMNDELELVATMQSASHAVAFTQATHMRFRYSMRRSLPPRPTMMRQRMQSHYKTYAHSSTALRECSPRLQCLCSTVT